VLEQLLHNIAANQAPDCSVQKLDFRALGDLPPAQLGNWRRLLAADVLYAGVIVQPFVATLAALLDPRQGV